MDFFKAFYMLAIGSVLLLGRCQSHSEEEQDAAERPDGEKVYKKYCITCHGAKGDLQTFGAADLSSSELSLEERISVIKKGRGVMNPFENVLTEAEIEAVVQYTQSMGKDE